MNQELKNMTEEWMALERKTLEQRKEAEKFYESNLMKLITDDYIERNKDKVFEDVKYLVVSVGTSYEPIVLNINLFNPERVMFLHTKKTEHVLNKIVSNCNLSANCYEKRQVSETNPLDIYREIKRIYLAWNKPAKMYIDFTGGTKSMSTAAAMAGAMIDVQLVYVGSDNYLADFRKPNPGSETLFYISNPLAVFGDLEIEKALTLFNVHNFAGVAERLENLKNNIPDPAIRQQLNFAYLLAKVYEAWDSLDFCPAYEYITQLNFQLHRDRMNSNFLLMDCMSKLQKQENILSNLNQIPQLLREKRNMEILQNKEMITALMFIMYQNAKTREQQEKYDMATLLFYRLLEMIEQCRLSHYKSAFESR